MGMLLRWHIKQWLSVLFAFALLGNDLGHQMLDQLLGSKVIIFSD